MNIHSESVLLGFALTLITAAGQSTPWLSRSMLTVFAVSSSLGFHSVSAISHNSNDASSTLKDQGEDVEERNLRSLCKKFAGCDRKYPARVLVCDKPRGTPPKMYCTNLSRKPEIARRINMGRSHCGACASCSGDPFETTKQLQDAVDLYLRNDYYPCPPIATWNVSGISDFAQLFSASRNGAAAEFNDDISMWDMSSATTTSGMFANALAFNQPIGAWNTANVQDMAVMFAGAAFFDQDISAWDVSYVETMDNMFFHAASFNQNLSPWSTSSLTTTKAMFAQATMFNGDVAQFDVSRVRDMSKMFFEAFRFNQDLSMWDVSSVDRFAQMFSRAVSYSQNLCAWGLKIQSSSDVLDMFSNSGCPQQADPDYTVSPPGPFCFSCS